MPGSEVNGLKIVLFSVVRKRDEAVAGPNFFPGCILRFLDFGLNLGAVNLGAVDAFNHLMVYSLSGKPYLNFFTKLAPWLLDAPD